MAKRIDLVADGLPITGTLEYTNPGPPPDSGADWDESRDYPGVLLVVRLPASTWYLRSDLKAPVSLFGEALHCDWGVAEGMGRYKSRIFRDATLLAAEAAARAAWAEAVQAVSGVVRARETRLAQRAATIVAANAVHGEITAED